jgi:hypothetical protein
MSQPFEHFTDNQSINNQLNAMLSEFSEASRSRMRKKIRHDIAALKKQGTKVDAQARHTFREFLPAQQLNHNGFDLEYSKLIGGQTPDWFDESNKLVLEVFTVERGGTSDPMKRMADNVTEKVNKYEKLVVANSLRFVVAVHGDFLSCFEVDECEESIKDHRLFEQHHNLSGIIFFAEFTDPSKPLFQVVKDRQQPYAYTYFANPHAMRPIDLNEACC